MEGGEEGKDDCHVGDGDVALLGVDDAVDAPDGDAEEYGDEPEGVAVGGRGKRVLRPPRQGETRAEGEEKRKQEEGFGVVEEVSQDKDTVARGAGNVVGEFEVGLDLVVPVGGVEPVGIGAVGELGVAEDERRVEELTLGMLKVDVG